MSQRASDSLTLKNVEIAYEHLREPTKKMNSEDLEYSVQIVLPKDHPQMAELTGLIKGQIEKVFPDTPPGKLKIALRDNDSEGNAQKYDHLKNTCFFNARRAEKKGRLPIVSRYNQPLMSVGPDQLFSGCICNVVVNFFSYNHPGSKGIAASIEALQIVDNVNVQRRDGQVDTSSAFEALDADESIDNFQSAPEPAEVVDIKQAAAEKDTSLPWG